MEEAKTFRSGLGDPRKERVRLTYQSDKV